MLELTTQVIETTELPTLPDQWQQGFNAYCDGLCCDEHASEPWQNGWWRALEEEAKAEVADIYDDEEWMVYWLDQERMLR